MVSVLVIGAGPAGLCAALSAREKGADVLVLEKNRDAGGLALLGTGLFNAFDPRRQYELQLADTPEAHLRDALRTGTQQGHPKLAETLCYQAHPALEWLEAHGVLWEDGLEMSPGMSAPRTHTARGGGKALIGALVRAAGRSGALLEYETEAIDINPAGERWRVSLRSRLSSGRTRLREIETRSLVLAGGGFSGSSAWLASIAPLTRPDAMGPESADGAMILAAERRGARIVGESFLQKRLCVRCEAGKRLPPGALPPVLRNPARFFVLGRTGKRLIREDIPVGRLIRVIESESGGRALFAAPLPAGSREAKNLAQTSGRTFRLYGSAAELELGENLPRGSLDALGRASPDPEGCLKAPFPDSDEVSWVCAHIGVRLLSTLGGLLIDKVGAVIDRENRPLPGLFAAGDCTGGIHGTDAPEGDTLLSAVVFGIQAGRSAAAAAL